MKPTVKLLPLTLVLALTAALVGCGGGGGGTTSGPPIGPPVIYLPNYVDTLDGLYHWSVLPVKMFFNLPSNWSTYYSSDLPTTASQSWNQPGKQAFFMVVSRGDQADVTCSFVNDPLPTWGTNAQGRTEYSYNLDLRLMISCTVTIAVHHSGGNLLTADEMQSVIAHELGHVLGISGHSPNSDDLMYYMLSGVTVPQEQDINTALTAYQAYFGNRSIPPEPMPAGAADPSHLIHRTIE